MFEVIKTTEALEAFINNIKNATWLAIDTEFLREKTYYAKLCLVQVEADGHRACIDPLSIDDLSAFYALLSNAKITKVLHAAHQDIEILYQMSGIMPTPIFDTQLAASVLGIGDQMGYARLVESMLGVSLAKTQSRTDWSRRPLKQAQLEYAIDDVRYLAQIYPKIIEQLTAKNRLSWMDKDFKKATDPSTYAINARERWKKVRGNQVLKRPQLAILRELAAWREEKAEAADRPRKWIISDEVLLDMARQQPHDESGLSSIRGVNVDQAKKNAKIWLSLIEKGKSLPESEWPELPRSKKPTASQNLLIDLLMLVIQLQAKQHNITPAAIATRKQVATMVQAGEKQLSNDWRGSLVNDAIGDVLSGKSQLGVIKNLVSLIEIK